jgi:hypothetical protein
MRSFENKKKENENRFPSFLFSVSPEALQLLLQLLDALGANALAREIYDMIRTVTEGAGRLILLQHDPILVNKDLDGILLLDPQGLADLYGQYDPSQVIHFANYSR